MSDIKSVLLVEDDRHIALALRIRLSAAGYAVIIAPNVSNALQAVSDAVPDIAVIDINLPDGNGIELMHAIAQQCREGKMTTVIMTASRKPGLRELAMQKGAAAFLEKPFPSRMLLDAITNHKSYHCAS